MASRGRTGRRKSAARGKPAVRQQNAARPPAGGASVGADAAGVGVAIAVAEDSLPAAAGGARVLVPGRLTAPVLVLNLNYVPVNVCTVRRAIVLLSKGKAELLEQRSETARIRSFSATLDAPSIIRLVYLVKRPFAPRRLSKKEVFLRDHYTCQYCGVKFAATYPGPCSAASVQRPQYLGQCGGRLRALQPGQGRGARPTRRI